MAKLQVPSSPATRTPLTPCPLLRSFRSIDGKRGKFEFELMVYGKEVCPRGEKVERIVEGPHGRAIWFVMSQIEEGRREEIQSLLNG